MRGQPPRECAIADTLEVVGERWTLLVLRELFLGVRRFEGIVKNTGGPRDVLTRRLRKLEGAGLVRRETYQFRPPRFEYHLTPAGHDLEPVLLTLRDWGRRHVPGHLVTPVFVHSCGAPVEPAASCARCGEPLMGRLAAHAADDGQLGRN